MKGNNISISDINRLIEANKSLLESNEVEHTTYDKIFKKICKDWKLNFGFVLEFGTSITAFFPIVENFLISSNIIVDDIKATVVYLTICALSITFRVPKEEYKSLFEELRLRGVYGTLKPLIAVINIMFKLFKFISEKIGVVISKLVDMFSYTALFVPFILTLNNIISNGLSMSSLINAISTNPINKSLSVIIGLTGLSLKHIINTQLKKLSEFNPLEISSIKKVITMFREIEQEEIEDDIAEDDIIKTYDQFKKGDEIINENEYVEIESEYGSIGEYIEDIKAKLPSDKEVEFKRIIGDYISDETNLDIRLANAVNNLKKFDQRMLSKAIKNSLNESIEVSEDIVEDVKLGKGAFNSFIKVLNALNFKEIKPNREECPEDFAIIYTFKEIERTVIKDTIKRFRSLDKIYQSMNTLADRVEVYFGIKGIKNTFFIEYGIMDEDKRLNLGEFKITQSSYKKILNMESKCLSSLQEELTGLDLSDLKTLMTIKRDLITFEPGFHFEKSNCIIKDNILSIGFYGLGQWNSGKLDKDNFDLLKTEFKKWVLTKKWKKLVQFNIKPDKFWVKFNVKVK